MFADDHMIISDSEDTLKRALRELNKIIPDYNFEMATRKQKKMEFYVKWPESSELILNNQPIKQVFRFNYLGCQPPISK
jgi:recombination DNA repair RAD52 pathway protein